MKKEVDYGKAKNKRYAVEKANKKKNPRFYNKNYCEDLHLYESEADQIIALLVSVESLNIIR